MNTIIKKSLQQSLTYTTYRETVTRLLSEGKATGNTQSEDLLHYSQLNETRMNRLEKTIAIPDEIVDELKELKDNFTFLTLAEGWCGDAAQIVPVLNKMALASDKINLKMVFRDENDDLMNLFLTNGSKSIPKVVIINSETAAVVNSWGARPKPAQQLIVDYKKEHGVVDEAAKVALQKWYLKDKGITTMKEILALLK